MSAIIILIITSLLVATGFLISFFWAVKTGQYDDDYTPSVRILFDSDVQKNKYPEKSEMKQSTAVKTNMKHSCENKKRKKRNE